VAAIGTAFVRVKPDMDGFEKEATTGIGNAAKKAAAAFVAVFAAAKIGGFLKGAIEEASDLNENMTKTEAIFGSASDAVVEFAGKGAKALGQSKNEVINAAATFGTFGKAAGLGGAELADFSTGFVSLSTDLASFSNTSPEEAVEAIGSALRGEAEPMRKYGVLLDDASLRQEALRQGLIRTTKEALTPQQKILAAQALIYKQTGDAQGDFAKTSGGLANQQRILSAQWTDMKGRIGDGLLPVMVQLAGFATGTLLPGLERIGGFLGQTLGPVFAGLRDAVGKVREAFEFLFSDTDAQGFAEIMDNVFGNSGRLVPAFRVVGDVIRQVVFGFQALFAAFKDGDVTSDGFVGVMERIGIVIRSVVDFVRANFLPALSAVGDFLSRNLAPILAGLGASLGTYILPIVGALAGAMGGALVGAVVSIAGALASPIILIGALAAALVYAFQHSDRFREIVLTVAGVVREKLLAAFQVVSAFVTDTAVPAIQRIAEYVRANFIPALAAMGEFIQTRVVPAFRAIAGFVTDSVLPALRVVAGFLIDTFTPTFRAMADFFTGTAMPALAGLLARVKENLPAFLSFAQGVGTVIAVVAALIAKVVGFLLPILLDLAGFLTRTLFAAIGVVIGALGEIIRSFQWAWEAAQTVARIVGEAFGAVRTAVETAKTMAGLFLDKIRDINVPKPLKDIAELIGRIAGGLKSASEVGLGFLSKIPGIGDGPGAPRGGLSGGPMLARVKSMIAGTGASISSTYRDPARNRAAGGSPTSYHLDKGNPAVDVVGPAGVLDRLYSMFKAQGGYRELLWRTKGHYDHLHVADQGGVFKGPGMVWMGAGQETFASGLAAKKVADLPAGGMGGSGPIELGEASLHRLADLILAGAGAVTSATLGGVSNALVYGRA